LLLGYPRFALSMTIGTAHQINYPCTGPWFVLCSFAWLYFLFSTASDMAHAKVFGCGGGKNWWQFCTLQLAFTEKSGF